MDKYRCDFCGDAYADKDIEGHFFNGGLCKKRLTRNQDRQIDLLLAIREAIEPLLVNYIHVQPNWRDESIMDRLVAALDAYYNEEGQDETD
jgi:hypothetical protein